MNSTHVDMQTQSGSVPDSPNALMTSGAPHLIRFSQERRLDQARLEAAVRLAVHFYGIQPQPPLPPLSRSSGGAVDLARLAHDGDLSIAPLLDFPEAGINYDMLQAGSISLDNARHAMSGFHKQAASHHESAAHSHREAAALFDASMSDEAGEMGNQALTHSHHAHNSSKIANSDSNATATREMPTDKTGVST